MSRVRQGFDNGPIFFLRSLAAMVIPMQSRPLCQAVKGICLTGWGPVGDRS